MYRRRKSQSGSSGGIRGVASNQKLAGPDRWEIIDFPGGQINDPSSENHYSLPFLPATPSSPSRTLEGLFQLTQHPPFKGLQLASCVASGTTVIQEHRQVYPLDPPSQPPWVGYRWDEWFLVSQSYILSGGLLLIISHYYYFISLRYIDSDSHCQKKDHILVNP